MSGNEFSIALAGQPNAGKSTLFNCLTGVRQFVANYPGVTVEKRTGAFEYNKLKFNVTDLPGTYSLTSYSLEERVARGFLLNEKPDLTVHVIDSSNLSRSLYLTFQILELGIPVIAALNMADVAKKRGVNIDNESLERELGIPFYTIMSSKSRGIEELKAGICKAVSGEGITKKEFELDYGKNLEEYISKVTEIIKGSEIAGMYPARWLAIKFMENDSEIIDLIEGKKYDGKIKLIGSK